ncbi:hypothetical protein Tco_0403348 [Tanacetum coccineum]
MYVEYLKEFWYTTEVEEETKTITFLLSWCDEPLSFTQDEFISAISLPVCKEFVPLPPMETVRAGLATLGLFDKEKPTLSSTTLVNSSPLEMKYFSPIWKLFMQYIVKCLGGMQEGLMTLMNLNHTITIALLSSLYLGDERLTIERRCVTPRALSLFLKFKIGRRLELNNCARSLARFYP